MNAFGFENFKRFKNFEAINLSNINFLVGANNSGKSTFIKALLLAVQNLKTVKNVNTEIRQNLSELPLFRLDLDGISNPRVGTFNRAITYDVVDDDIVFQFSSNAYSFAFAISREVKSIDYSESPVAPITEVMVYSADFDIRFHFDLEEKIAEIEFYAESRGINRPYFEAQLSELREDLVKAQEKAGENISTAEMRSLEEQIRHFEDILGFEVKEYVKVIESFGEYSDGSIANLLNHLLKSALAGTQGKALEGSVNVDYLLNGDKQFLFYMFSSFNMIADDVSYILENKKVEYI